MPRSTALLVTDLDGTLLTTGKTVTPATVSALRAGHAAGLALAVASARPYRLIDTLLEPEVLSLFSVVIVSNGAAVIDPSTKDVLHEDALEAGQVAAAIGLLRARWPAAAFGWESGTEFSSDARFLELCGSAPISRDPHPDRIAPLPAGPVHQLVMATPPHDPAGLIAETASVLGSGYHVTDSRGGVLEISPARVSKASATAWWAASRSLDLGAVVAFGDEHNDLPLLTAAGMGVAMGNASDEVRAATAYSTGGNDEDGVAAFLHSVVLPALGRTR